MSDNNSIVALKAQIVQGMLEAERLGELDRRSRRELERQKMEMTLAAQAAMAAQDTAAAIHLYTVHRAERTLTTAAVVRSLRSPQYNCSDLDQLEAVSRKRYLQTMNWIAANAVEKVLATLE